MLNLTLFSYHAYELISAHAYIIIHTHRYHAVTSLISTNLLDFHSSSSLSISLIND